LAHRSKLGQGRAPLKLVRRLSWTKAGPERLAPAPGRSAAAEDDTRLALRPLRRAAIRRGPVEAVIPLPHL